MTFALSKVALLCTYASLPAVLHVWAEDLDNDDKSINVTASGDGERFENETIADARTPDDQQSVKLESWVSIFGLTFLLGLLAIAIILKMVQACMSTKGQGSGKSNKQSQPNKPSSQSKKGKDICKQHKVWNYPGPPSFTETISIPSSTDTASTASTSDSKSSEPPLKADNRAGAAIAISKEKSGEKKVRDGTSELKRSEGPQSRSSKKDGSSKSDKSQELAKAGGKQEPPVEVCKTPQTSAKEGTGTSSSQKSPK